MRKLAILPLAGALSLMATSAWACTLPPPPHWPSLLSDSGPAMAIVRVVKIERAEAPRVTDYFETWNYTATVRPINVLQGSPKSEYTVVGVGEVQRLKDGPMFCADRMTLAVGDIRFGYETADGGLNILEPQHIPDQFVSRLEAFQ